MQLRKFRRSATDKKIAGLFGGLGDAFGVDPTYLRLAFVLLALVTGVVPSMIAYAVGWFITVEGTEGGSRADTADAGAAPQDQAPAA